MQLNLSKIKDKEYRLMHKKDKVKEVIDKYIEQGKDFFELTPSYLQTLIELKGYSERTLKRGRTEYKSEHKNLLKGKSKAVLNLKKKVQSFLDDNPQTSLEQLKKKFSSQDRKQISVFFNGWKAEDVGTERKKALPSTKIESVGSLRQKVFTFLDRNPDLTLSKLEVVFKGDNKKTISNYLDQWRKEKSRKRKKISVKQRINDFLDANPLSSLKDLRGVFPDINPSSIGAYHSLWKNSRKSGRQLATAKAVKNHLLERNNMSLDSAKQIIDALSNTVEAQKKAIEILKSQNAMLEEMKAYSFPELKGMSKKEIDKFERVMATFLRGLREG